MTGAEQSVQAGYLENASGWEGADLRDPIKSWREAVIRVPRSMRRSECAMAPSVTGYHVARVPRHSYESPNPDT